LKRDRGFFNSIALLLLSLFSAEGFAHIKIE